MRKHIWSLAFLCAGTLLVGLAVPAHGAVDAFLKLNGVNGDAVSKGPQTIELISWSLGAQAPGVPNPVAIPVHLSLNDPGVPGPSSFFDVFCDAPAQNFPAQSFFDIFTEITLPDGVTTPPVQLPPVNDFPAKSFFDIFVEIDLPSLGTHELHLHGDAMQPGLTFMPPTDSARGPSSFFDIFTELDAGAQINPTMPLYRVTMTSQSVPEPSTLALVAIGAAVLLGAGRKHLMRKTPSRAKC